MEKGEKFGRWIPRFVRQSRNVSRPTTDMSASSVDSRNHEIWVGGALLQRARTFVELSFQPQGGRASMCPQWEGDDEGCLRTPASTPIEAEFMSNEMAYTSGSQGRKTLGLVSRMSRRFGLPTESGSVSHFPKAEVVAVAANRGARVGCEVGPDAIVRDVPTARVRSSSTRSGDSNGSFDCLISETAHPTVGAVASRTSESAGAHE